ncbi:MAG: glutathione S-transferase family protein [Actinobacteria bacterium]|nr:MAG: glutathione S-transferase family protein [Actinomycetota bacterium]
MNGLRLYDYAASANCYKVRLLLAQLGAEYERVPVEIFAGETLTDAYARVSPARTTPVLETDDGRFLPESAAILLFLADGTPFLPDDPFERAQVARWLVYEQADVIPPIGGLRFRLLTGRLEPGGEEAGRRRRDGLEMLRLLDEHLSGREFFVAAAYSVADVAIYGYLHVAGEAGYDLAAYPHVVAWLERVRRQPGHMNDLQPYPANARAGAGRSVYD